MGKSSIIVTARPTPIIGAYIIERTCFTDDRGVFDRVFSRSDIKQAIGRDFGVMQTALVENKLAGTLRGLHYQVAPHTEAKIVTCVGGIAQDVIFDLRKDSPTYGEGFGITLEAGSGIGLYMPPGIAHGYVTVEANAWMLYQTDREWNQEASRSISWESASKMKWGYISPQCMSTKDSNAPLFDPTKHFV